MHQPDTIYVYDIEENKNSYVSEGVKRNIGYTENEIKEMENQLLPRLMHPDDFDYYLQHTYPLYQNLKDKEIISHEFRMKDKNGSWHWFYCKESIFTRKPDGTAKEIFGIISDITENKNAQEEIIKARDLSAAIINSLPGIFYLFNQEGKYLRWNKNLEIVSGYSAEEISRIHPLDFFDSDEKELLAKKISDTFKYGEANVEANFLLKNKNKIAYHFTGLFIKYEEANCLMGVGIDISERKEAQEKIQQTSEELRAFGSTPANYPGRRA
jgi:PAS domain S-box-containing protein